MLHLIKVPLVFRERFKLHRKTEGEIPVFKFLEEDPYQKEVEIFLPPKRA